MILKDVISEDFLNYKEPSMFLIFPYCDFKCCKEANNDICQNMSIVKQPNIEIDARKLVKEYIENPITKAVVCGGLEPLESFNDLVDFINVFRKFTDDTIIIYTGFRNDEIEDKIEILKKYKNIIIKFGRFIPNQELHFDPVLGINLSSLNQYAVKIS